MATKKQKREAAMVRREQFLKQERERGLEAQKLDKDRRDAEIEEIREIADQINQRHYATLRNAGLR